MKLPLFKTIYMVCFFSTFLFMKTNGQIIYHDRIPDDSVHCSSNLCSDSLNIDINSDGTADFKFLSSYRANTIGSNLCVYHMYFRSCLVYPKDLNGIASDSIRPLSLVDASPIDSNLIWTDTSVHANSNMLSYNYTKTIQHCPPSSPAINTITGNWYGHSDEYLGVFIIVNGLKYYAWIRLSVISATYIIVKDYAYNSTAGEQILAGDSGNVSSGIIHHSVSGSEFSVYPNPAKNDLIIYSEQPGNLQLINHLGQVIYSGYCNEKESHMNISDFSPGIYTVTFSEKQTIQSKRILISN
jgi:hypothetical protein